MRKSLTSRSLRVAVTAVAATLALAACGSGDDSTVGSAGGSQPSSAGTVAASPVPGIDAERNDADIAFIVDMKPHHSSAIEMAKLAADRAANAQVKDLAQRIVAAQDPEIETMQKMAAAWGVDLETAQGASTPGMDMSGGMDMGGDIAALEPLSGPAFDREFLTRMTAHHESAVVMSEREVADGQNAQAKELAQQIITAQKAEIAEMRTLMAAL